MNTFFVVVYLAVMAASSLVTTVQSQGVICSVCSGGEVVVNTASVALLDTGFNRNLTCLQLDQVARAMIYNESECLALQSSTSVRDTCGCASSGTPDNTTNTTTKRIEIEGGFSKENIIGAVLGGSCALLLFACLI
jgi:hypothetical protein